MFGAYINCCLYPVSKTLWLSFEDLELIDNKLSLRLSFGLGPRWQFTETQDDEIKQEDCGARGKERSIGYVIEKVTRWRKLYNGYYDDSFNHFRMSLEQAAECVGVSKKSLDDYLAQLRAGRQFGFDFNTNKERKIGELRSFVK